MVGLWLTGQSQRVLTRLCSSWKQLPARLWLEAVLDVGHQLVVPMGGTDVRGESPGTRCTPAQAGTAARGALGTSDPHTGRRTRCHSSCSGVCVVRPRTPRCSPCSAVRRGPVPREWPWSPARRPAPSSAPRSCYRPGTRPTGAPRCRHSPTQAGHPQVPPTLLFRWCGEGSDARVQSWPCAARSLGSLF